MLPGEDTINPKWDNPAYKETRMSFDRSSGPYAHVWDPGLQDRDVGEAGYPHPPPDCDILVGPVNTHGSSPLRHHIPGQPHGFYDARMDHVYEKPT